MTAKEVLGSLCGIGSNCLWSPNRLVAVPNTTTIVGWEADLLLLHPSGWVWEVEIKVSVADFRREFRTKATKHEVLRAGQKTFESKGYYSRPHTIKNKHVQKFFFAVPKDVFDKLRPEDVPEYAGVIVIDPDRVDSWKRPVPYIERRAKNLPGVEKVGAQFRIRLLELAHARLWSFAYLNDSLLEIYEKEEVS